MELIDFTDCRITNKTYGGANGNKLSGIYNTASAKVIHRS